MNVPLFTFSVVLKTGQSSRPNIYQIFANKFLWHIDQLFFQMCHQGKNNNQNDIIISVINRGDVTDLNALTEHGAHVQVLFRVHVSL